jgi:GNAT superfamily N-acetyltransferase
MLNNIIIEPMTAEFILWRCLHRGPLSRENIDSWPPDEAEAWRNHRAVNVPILRKLIETYGTCAMLAWDGDKVVGFVRFYPKALFSIQEAGLLCLQQAHPAGPSGDFVKAPFPPLKEIHERTLIVHCLMTGSPFQDENPYQRKGIGTRMVRELMQWAKDRDWESIEAKSFEDIPLLYEHTGNAGRTFWAKLGFRLVQTDIGPAPQQENDFVRTAKEQATALGLDPEVTRNTYTMRIELT